MDAMIKDGDLAPNFSLPNQNGEKITLEQFQGKKVILYFYPGDNTPGCTMEARDFNYKLEDFERNNAVIMGISKDSTKSHLKFIEKLELKLDLLSDEDGTMCEQYNVIKEKNMFGKIVQGIERSTFIINEHGKVEKVWRKVSVKGHVDEVFKQICSV